jgi:hypothetical protein
MTLACPNVVYALMRPYYNRSMALNVAKMVSQTLAWYEGAYQESCFLRDPRSWQS